VIFEKCLHFKGLIVSQTERLDEGPNKSVLGREITKGFIHRISLWIKQMIHTRLGISSPSQFLFARHGSLPLAKFAVKGCRTCAVELVLGVVA